VVDPVLNSPEFLTEVPFLKLSADRLLEKNQNQELAPEKMVLLHPPKLFLKRNLRIFCQQNRTSVLLLTSEVTATHDFTAAAAWLKPSP